MTVDNYIESLPEDDIRKFELIRNTILEAHPAIVEMIKYGIPFYQLRSPIFYLAPQKGQLILGFCQGAALDDPLDMLSGDQKIVRHYIVPDYDLIDLEGLVPTIAEAVLYDLNHASS